MTSKQLRTEFGHRLRELREKRRLSQSDLARVTGFQPAAIAHFEAGRRTPTIYNLRRLCMALITTSDWLIDLP